MSRLGSSFMSCGRFGIQVSSIVIRFLCAKHFLNEHIFEIRWCEGPSMLPSFNMSGTFVLIDHFSQRFRNLEIGDVMVYSSPESDDRYVLKRVTGLPGDSVCVDPTESSIKHITVPKGKIWFTGDNLSNSTDSRSYGPVPMGLLKGRVVAKMWPDFQILSNPLEPVDYANPMYVLPRLSLRLHIKY
ncbi:peptidase S24/S26A/S26B/S26C [Spinellus fusiger]|nr:peptidase S24/S26A/S26B/S26C [Spinellus fusiger]